jgi:DNA polymerase-1
MTWIIPTIHPAALLRGSKPIPDVIRADLAKANRVSFVGPTQIENYVIVLPSNPSGLQTAVRAALAWMDRWIGLRCPVAVDIETSSLDFFNCKLYSVALAGEDGCNTAVAFTFPNYQSLPWDAAMALDAKLREVLRHPQISKVYHNAPYDYAVLTLKGYEMGGPIEDTMAYHFLVQPDIPHDLGWVGHTYLDVEPWKIDHMAGGEKMVFTTDTSKLLLYNAKDALNTMKLRRPLYDEVLERGMNAELISYQMAFARLAAQMEIVGVPINFDKRKQMGDELLTRLALLKQRMRDWLNWPDFNPMAKAHAVEALYNKKYVGLEATVFTEKTKQPSTKYETIIDHMEHPFVKDFIEFVENQHCYATQYRDDSPNPKDPQAGAYRRAMRADGRLHPHWSSTSQKGSRFTSKPNIQNQRVRDRAFIEAPPGRVFIGSDKDQLELRLAAAMSGVRELVVEMRKPDGDPHRLAAINVYGEKFLAKSKEEQKRLRDAIKTTVYASLYRAGVKTVHKSIRKKKFLDPQLRAALTLRVVGHIYNSYFGKYVEIPAWHDHNYYLAETQGYLEIPPLGRRRYFPVQPPPYTEVANWPIQCLGSDIVGKEMVDIDEELKRQHFKDAHIILHGHDAVYIECRENDAEAICVIVDRLFGHSVVDGPAGPVILTSKAKIGRNLKEVK